MEKPLANLSLDDLEAHAVWRVDDSNGVEMAMPVDLSDIPEETDDLLAVRTRFRLANGWSFLGWSMPSDWPATVEFFPPVIIHGGRSLPVVDDEGRPTRLWAGLAPKPEDVFPVAAEPDVTVGGRHVLRRYDPDGHDADVRRPGAWARMFDWLDRAIGRD